MSLPYFPEEALEITCEQSFDMLLGSIAMEELALSHIMNAEGEKLQYVLGTLTEKPCPRSTPQEILEVNRSVSELLDKVADNQVLLKGMLQQVLEARGRCCPPTPECPPETACSCLWIADRNRTWNSGSALPWKKKSENKNRICWQGCSPGVIHLCPQRTYLAYFSFRVHSDTPGPVQIALQTNCGGVCENILICECTSGGTGCAVPVSGCTMLSSQCCGSSSLAIQFVLKTPCSVLLEQAVLNCIEIKC